MYVIYKLKTAIKCKLNQLKSLWFSIYQYTILKKSFKDMTNELVINIKMNNLFYHIMLGVDHNFKTLSFDHNFKASVIGLDEHI